MKIDDVIRIAAIIVLIIGGAFLYKSCTSKSVIIREEHTVIDSVAVQTLRTEMEQMRNKLGVLPKIITVPYTVNDTITVADTITVYPVGSLNKKRDYAFATSAEKDSLKLKVNTDLYTFVYTDNNGKFFYEDSLRVWLSDIDIKRTITELPPLNKSMVYLLGGIGVHKYQQNVSGQSISQTDAQINLGAAYSRGAWGLYILGAPNGASVGGMLNLSDIYRKVTGK